MHTSSGLHQNWMRDYDPTTGRYIQADPLGLVDGASVYGYALQNPGRYTDPRGEFLINPITIALTRIIAGHLVKQHLKRQAAKAAAAAATAAAAAASAPGMLPGADAAKEEEQCENEDCPFEMPVRNLRRIRDNDPRLAGLNPHELKDSGSEDLYINREGCVYVGPAKNARGHIGRDAVAWWTGLKI